MKEKYVAYVGTYTHEAVSESICMMSMWKRELFAREK